MQGSRRVGSGRKPQARTFGWSAGLGSGQFAETLDVGIGPGEQMQQERDPSAENEAIEESLHRVDFKLNNPKRSKRNLRKHAIYQEGAAGA